MKISTFQEACEYLYSHIPQTDVHKFPGEVGLERQKRLMQYLGDPQEKYQVVHVAGTSGKGSTSYLTSLALQSQGMSVGLHLSPHILDIRERIQINNELIDEESFTKNLAEIARVVDKVASEELGSPTYFEVLVALAYYSFATAGVEYVVMETGMGGLLDGTNVVKNPHKLCIITPIGFDHMHILGNTLPEIASQKAGIIQSHNTVIIGSYTDEVMSVFRKRAEEKQAQIVQVEPGIQVNITQNGTTYFDPTLQEEVGIGLIGIHQADNAALASAAVTNLAQQNGFNLDTDTLKSDWKQAHLPARVDVQQYASATLIIDGAHNEQKMSAFLATLELLYPGQRLPFLVAFKHGKDIEQMIHMIEQHASEIIVTQFRVEGQDMLNLSENKSTVASYVTRVPVRVYDDAREALQAATQGHEMVVVTGSLYFSSEVYHLIKNKE